MSFCPISITNLSDSSHKKAYASVRFMGASLDPLDITMALLLPYDHIHRDGEPCLRRRSRDGIVREYSPYRGGMWSMSSKAWVDSPKLDVHICWLLEQLEVRKEEILQLLAGDIQADIFCYSAGPHAEPPDLLSETLNRANALGIHIEIDHYDTSPDDDGG